jgi:hypothetical protein
MQITNKSEHSQVLNDLPNVKTLLEALLQAVADGLVVQEG